MDGINGDLGDHPVWVLDTIDRVNRDSGGLLAGKLRTDYGSCETLVDNALTAVRVVGRALVCYCCSL